MRKVWPLASQIIFRVDKTGKCPDYDQWVEQKNSVTFQDNVLRLVNFELTGPVQIFQIYKTSE